MDKKEKGIVVGLCLGIIVCIIIAICLIAAMYTPTIYEGNHMKFAYEKTLKDVEGYEYLKQIDIASADGNVYEIMVPKNYDAEGDKRFVTYYGDGFMLSMYARELFAEESLEDFLEVNNDFVYEDPEKDYTNVEKTEMIEENGLIYQICTAYSVDYEGKSKPHAELVAAIPLGGTDVLSFSLSYEEYVMSEDFEGYLEELERYYGIPVMQFADLKDANMAD